MLSGAVRYLKEHVLPSLELFADDFFHSLATSIEAGGGAVLKEAAVLAVTAAEAAGGSGSEKFAAAITAVKNELSSKGIPLIENAVQGAVLAAVAKLQG